MLTPSQTELLAKEQALRNRMQRVALALWIVGAAVIATLPWMTGIWSLINMGLLMMLAGCGFWFYASIRFHGRSIDEAYRLGYDLGYEIGWHAREFEDAPDGDPRPLAPRKTNGSR